MFEYLMPEDLEELRSSLERKEGLKDFLGSVRGLLTSTPVDQGAFSDTIYLAGKRLSQWGFWDVVPDRVLASALVGMPGPAAALFLEAAPEGYRARVVEIANGTESAKIRANAKRLTGRISTKKKKVAAYVLRSRDGKVLGRRTKARILLNQALENLTSTGTAIEAYFADSGVVVGQMPQVIEEEKHRLPGLIPPKKTGRAHRTHRSR